MPVKSSSLHQLVPSVPEGWIIDSEPKIYIPETLYEYINGGAELYISYGMDSAISTRFSKDGVGEIRVEIFDMHEAKNAFGVFTHTRTTDEKILGQGSQYFTGAQIFWKKNFFVSVIANDENDEIKKAIKTISKEIEIKIKENGELPEVLNLLPDEQLVKDGFIYFHHYIWLNSYYYLSNDNFLMIDNDVDAILAKYGSEDNRHFILIVDYSSKEKQKVALNNFRKLFMDGEREKECIQIEDGSWLGYKDENDFLVAVFNAGSKKEADDILMKAESNIKSLTE
ncbi:MAG: hypothetical protein JW894_04540 [Bacteroidales bacterium]|nr:hypothetical protein [Bacteroidales bacterium]